MINKTGKGTKPNPVIPPKRDVPIANFPNNMSFFVVSDVKHSSPRARLEIVLILGTGMDPLPIFGLKKRFQREKHDHYRKTEWRYQHNITGNVIRQDIQCDVADNTQT
ncbi:hypothetical protein HAX54_041524 [Datura stramonium]|uniref:Uncharacterized protein n=1 Tax=Datura stramonium TaxID=4076 RepID=A0ABS8RKJ7_DATST|nr:hypothetical protein [Datura stramonium]